MSEKETRVKNLQDIRKCLIESYGYAASFKVDLDEIVEAIDKRIKVILEGRK